MKSFKIPTFLASLFGFCLFPGLDMPLAHADFTFGTPTNLGPAVNSALIDHFPRVSADGLSLWFIRLTGLNYNAMNTWMTTRATKDDTWGSPVYLGPWADPPSAFKAIGVVPGLTTRDGLEVYFLDFPRPGGYGGPDLSMMKRQTIDDPWGPVVNLGPTVNSAYWEGTGSISADGLFLFFSSNRPGGYGSGDLYVTRRANLSAPWGKPVNLGPTVNTPTFEEWAFMSADGSTLYWDCERPGGYGDNDIWQVSILPIVDFNGDGIVDMKDFSNLAQYWGQDESSVDMGPKPLGDGIVDVQDLVVLGEYWLTYPGTVAHWKLDETEGNIAHDSAGDHDGTLNGNPAWRPGGGKMAGALELDGIDDYVSTHFVLNPAAGPFSVFAWVKGGAPGQVIVSQQAAATYLGSTWLGVDALNGKLITGLMSPQPPLQSESVITDGKWHEIGLVWDGSRRVLYVDGAEVARDTRDLIRLGSDGGLHIGAGKGLEAGSFWSGLIDDVRTYDRAVTP